MMDDKKLERYVALVPLLRYHQPVPVGAWVRLEKETGEILGVAQAVPESAIRVTEPAADVIAAVVRSGAAFADGALEHARRVVGLAPAQCMALALEHAAEFVRAHGGGVALVKGITGADLEKWGKR